MSSLPLADRAVSDVSTALRAGDVSARELTEACLARVERDAERLNTFLSIDEDAALANAPLRDDPFLRVPTVLEEGR